MAVVEQSRAFPTYTGTGSILLSIRVAGVMVKLFSVDIILIWRETAVIWFFCVGGWGSIMRCYEYSDT